MADKPVVAQPLSLELLFRRASDKVASDKQLKADREALGDRRTDPDKRSAIEQRVREWEFNNEWTTIASAMRATRFNCVCGRTHTGPAQLLLKQEHRSVANVTRLVVPVGEPAKGLPRLWIWADEAVISCVGCAAEKGYHE